MPDVVERVRDAAYVAVGLGVLFFQKAQVQRHHLRQALTEQVETVASTLDRRFGGTTSHSNHTTNGRH